MLMREDVLMGVRSLPKGRPMRASSIRYYLRKHYGVEITTCSLVHHLQRMPEVMIDTSHHVNYYEVIQ